MTRATICAVAIAKDEADRVRAWSAPLVEADRMFILDTGSTDSTAEFASFLGVMVGNAVVSSGGFRFDQARNNVLDRMRDMFDYVFWVDLDETVEPGWREKFDLAVEKYGRQEVFSTVRFWGNLAYDRPTIHRATADWSWRRPVHEELVFKDRQEYSPAPTGIRVDHHQDPSKDRSQYLPLMKIACEEDPDDTQVAFWYARELMYQRDYSEAVPLLRMFADNTDAWVIERMQACLHLNDIYAELNANPVMRQRVLQQALELAPWRREPLLAMAGFKSFRGDGEVAQAYATQALAIPHTMRSQDYLTSDSTWDDELLRKEFGLA